MAKKRKSQRSSASQPVTKTSYDATETFDDSEDEFYAGRDKVLLDEEPVTKRRRIVEEQERALQPSDEEILAYDDDNNDEEVDEDDEAEEGMLDGGDDGEFWGTSKADYYGADEINEEEEALEEEAEAKRLRQKQLQHMTEADFGFDENDWTSTAGKESGRGPVVEKLPDLVIPQGASEEDKLRILTNRYPEFDFLSKDLAELQQSLTSLRERAKATIGQVFERPSPPVQVVKHRALMAYLSSISMYFAILSSAHTANGRPMEPSQLRAHAVMESLARSRLLWDRAKDLEDSVAVRAAEEVAIQAAEEVLIHAEEVNGHANDPKTSGRTAPSKPKSTIKKQASVLESQKKSRSEHVIDPKHNMSEPARPKPPKKDRFDLQALLDQSATKGADADDSDFGDEVRLTEEQAAEKDMKRKSLRFYTSQIGQKSKKRSTATREAGGDDDLPYKERFRDKQTRLLEEAERRGKEKASAHEQLDDDDVPVAGGNEEDNEYYDMISAKTQAKKSDKKARAEAHAEAERLGGQVYEQEHVGPDGKRAITYAIAKNKGLAPKRKKEVRNPRVKKRKKYDEKMKKLGSIRQVYKGGEGRGGYGGELTGIKTNVVKSVRL